MVSGRMGEVGSSARGHEMKVFCRSTNGNAELSCGVCGQGFVLFWERHPRTERAALLSEVQETLRRHHRVEKGPEAHPQGGFLAPGWGNPNELAAAAWQQNQRAHDL